MLMIRPLAAVDEDKGENVPHSVDATGVLEPSVQE